jgi:uncharacterized RDD family membrane protein YckC
MTCQHCQTWILDDDHRCRRCGRRVRSLPSRISPANFPIAATATASAYDFATYPEPEPIQARTAEPTIKPGQQQLFTAPVNDPRVIAFDSLTTNAERESIRARAADLARPAPLKTARVEIRRPRLHKGKSLDQRSLDFQQQQEVLSPPLSDIICDAPVAPVRLRAEAAFIDGLLILAAYALAAALFLYKVGEVPLGNHPLTFLFLAAITVPLFYKLLWTLAGRDSFGMQCSGIRLVDFDGNPPSQERRYLRLFGSVLSFLAAGVGLIWMLVDQDRLSWHDHISSTFPTLDSEY